MIQENLIWPKFNSAKKDKLIANRSSWQIIIQDILRHVSNIKWIKKTKQQPNIQLLKIVIWRLLLIIFHLIKERFIFVMGKVHFIIHSNIWYIKYIYNWVKLHVPCVSLSSCFTAYQISTYSLLISQLYLTSVNNRALAKEILSQFTFEGFNSFSRG